MATAKKKRAKSGGGKLRRTHGLTVRLDPKLRYLADLAARKQRRTLSSFIEWAIERSLDDVVLDEMQGHKFTVGNSAEALWNTNEVERFVTVAVNFPDLLTHDERVLWEVINADARLWGVDFPRPDGSGVVTANFLNFPRLREHWDDLKAVARGEADPSILPGSEEKEADLPALPGDDGDGGEN